MIRLVKQDFRAWLLKNRKVLVGRPEDFKHCPFCNFLKSKGAKKVSIHISHRIVDGKAHVHSQWQKDFQINAIKQQRSLDVIGLRGSEALQVLDEL